MILLFDRLSTEKKAHSDHTVALFLPVHYIVVLLVEALLIAVINVRMIKRVVLLVFVFAALSSGAWIVFHSKDLKRLRAPIGDIPRVNNFAQIDLWTNAVDKVKGDRLDPGGPVETPPELRHYSDRYWFLATQIAETKKYNVPICRDYLDLAAMIERGDLVSVPGVTDTYVLFGVAQRVDDGGFTNNDDQGVTRDYSPLQKLAQSFGGRSYDLNDPTDRLALKANMLSSLRPAALKVLEEVAAAYHQRFDRPLPISSLVRPDQYQQALRRVNRNAVTIEAPPHSTGLAFDIDYRYMNGTEQTFVMTALARLKNEGRIEAIRERNANYHVFAFLNGMRPSDDLISASLDDAVPPGVEANHAAKAEDPPKVAKTRSSKHKATKISHNSRRRRKP